MTSYPPGTPGQPERDWAFDPNPAPTGYSGPPPTGPAPAGPPPATPYHHYPTAPQAPAATPYPAGYGYPPASYPTSAGWGPVRPGNVIAAAVLGYIEAGVLILAGFILLAGASIVHDWSESTDTSDHGFTAEFVTDGVINLVTAGLLIAGGVMFAAGKDRGRTLLTVGGGICLAASLYWLVRVPDHGGVAIWVLLFASLPIIALALSWTGAVTSWLRGAAAGPPAAPRPHGY